MQCTLLITSYSYEESITTFRVRRYLFQILNVLRTSNKVLDLFSTVRSLTTCRSYVAVRIRWPSCFVCCSQVIMDKGKVRADTPRMVWEGVSVTDLVLFEPA